MSGPMPPGFSVDLSGAAKAAARRIRRLGEAVPIDGKGQLMAWYHSRSNRLVHALQLRREREGPYFHQFIVFQLSDNGGFFRVDRRLRPKEDTPLNSLKDEGVPAFDTIEEVVAWDDPLFPASDCLISIEFKVDVDLALILKICRAIQAHPLAKVYTLQRYNCYFFAQTILLCVAYGASNWAGTGDWLLDYGINDSPILIRQRLTMSTLNPVEGFLIPKHHSYEYTGEMNPKLHPQDSLVATEFTFGGYLFVLTMMDTDTVRKQHSSILGLPRFVRRNDIHKLDICFISRRGYHVEEFYDEIEVAVQHLLETHWEEENFHPLKCCKNHMNRSVWDIRSNKNFSSIQEFKEVVIKVCSVQQQGSSSGLTPFSFTMKSTYNGDHQTAQDIPLAPSKVSFESFFIRISSHEHHNLFLAKVNPLHTRGLGRLSTEHVQQFHDYPNIINTRLVDTSLHSFTKNMAIKSSYNITQATPQETISNSNLGNIPRYRRAQNTLFRWRKSKQEQEQEMVAVTILKMQEHLVHLIRAHSIRVEQYKWATKAIATDVASDIIRVTNEIWRKLIE